MDSYERTRARLADVVGGVDVSRGDNDQPEWDALWVVVSDKLLRQLDAGNLAEFEAAFPIIADALRACDARGRGAAMPRLFGDFTRRAIAAGIDRTRFVDWFGPPEILNAPAGRMRGRALYFKDHKGHGRILATDRTVCFVHFSAIHKSGFRSLAGGELVEFTPMYGSFNGETGTIARDVVGVAELHQ